MNKLNFSNMNMNTTLTDDNCGDNCDDNCGDNCDDNCGDNCPLIISDYDQTSTNQLKNLKPKERLRMVLQDVRKIYAERHPRPDSEGRTPEQREKIRKEIIAFTEWFENLDPETYCEKAHIKIPFTLTVEARKDIEKLGVNLFYHHVTYSWFVDVRKTCE